MEVQDSGVLSGTRLMNRPPAPWRRRRTLPGPVAVLRAVGTPAATFAVAWPQSSQSLAVAAFVRDATTVALWRGVRQG
jgi:hypothetical protein